MAVLDDIRDGKGLKPITSTYFTCQNCSGCKHLNERGYCEFTACIIPCSVRATIPEVKPQTNADRIRSMTDEEMAEWMAKYCERKTVFCPNFGAHDCQESCEQCWLDWLRTEVTG